MGTSFVFLQGQVKLLFPGNSKVFTILLMQYRRITNYLFRNVYWQKQITVT